MDVRSWRYLRHYMSVVSSGTYRLISDDANLSSYIVQVMRRPQIGTRVALDQAPRPGTPASYTRRYRVLYQPTSYLCSGPRGTHNPAYLLIQYVSASALNELKAIAGIRNPRYGHQPRISDIRASHCPSCMWECGIVQPLNIRILRICGISMRDICIATTWALSLRPSYQFTHLIYWIPHAMSIQTDRLFDDGAPITDPYEGTVISTISGLGPSYHLAIGHDQRSTSSPPRPREPTPHRHMHMTTISRGSPYCS